MFLQFTGKATAMNKGSIASTTVSSTRFGEMKKQFLASKVYLLLLLPGIIYFIVFKYIPMYGLIIAFKDYNLYKGAASSPWVGMKHFIDFFSTPDFYKLIRNTLLLRVYDLIFHFPVPIIFALMLNEIKEQSFKKITQTVSLLPHFISNVVIVSLMIQMLSPRSGIVNVVIKMLGFEPIHFMALPEYFRTLYVGSSIWKGIGWGAIVYLAAISGISVSLYEAALVDGAGKWRQLWHITLPGIRNTIIIMLILRIGKMLDVGVEKTLLMYNPLTYETGDVIDSYVYRFGIQQAQYSFSTAVGFFKSVISVILVIFANKMSRKFSETSLW